MNTALRLHHCENDSRVNGPGRRFVIWVQGCTLNCPGCFNPETHSKNGGTLVPVSELAQQILQQADRLEGLTLSGGEPLFQAAALTALLHEIRRQSRLSVILLSGFSLEEINKMPVAKDLLSLVDVLIAGRYEQSQRIASHMIGSANKSVQFLTSRYSHIDLNIDTAEVFIHEDGTIILSGFDPLQWQA